MGGARVWAGIEELPAEVEGRPVRWLPDCPTELAGLSDTNPGCSAELITLDLSTGWKFHW